MSFPRKAILQGAVIALLITGCSDKTSDRTGSGATSAPASAATQALGETPLTARIIPQAPAVERSGIIFDSFQVLGLFPHVAADGDHVFVVNREGILLARDWARHKADWQAAGASDPIAADAGLVFYTASHGDDSRIIARTSRGGQIAWESQRLRNLFPFSMVVHGQSIYVAGKDAWRL